MKAKIIGIISLIIILAVAGVIYFQYFFVFGEGVKAGELNYMVHKGYIFKTYEGKLIQSGFKGQSANGVATGIQSYEFQFSVKLNEQIINGAMDRIVLHKENNTIFATVIDYKPSTSDTEKYKKQMQIYKDATSMLFDIPKDNVSVFVAGYLDGKVAEV